MKMSKKMSNVIYQAIARADEDWEKYMDAVNFMRSLNLKSSEENKAYLIKRGFEHLVGVPRSIHTHRCVKNALEQYRKPKEGAK